MTYLMPLMSTLLVVFLVMSTSATKHYGPPRATENHPNGRIVDNDDDDYGIEADQGIMKAFLEKKLEIEQCGTSIHDSKIIGGKKVDVEGKFPWMAAILVDSLKNGNWKQFCGGSIISNRHILTAAHCLLDYHIIGFKKPSDVMVRLGESNMNSSQASSSRRDVAVSKIFIPEKFDASDDTKASKSDIAILQLEERIDWTAMIRPICLPTAADLNLGGRMATVAGWGRTSEINQTPSPILKEVEAPIIELSLCKYLYNEARNIPIIREQICADHPTGIKNICNGTLPLLPIYKDHMCAGYLTGGKATCKGDSGGPLMFRMDHTEPWTVIGVVSGAFPGCGRKFTPSIYTRVVPYNDWIQSKWQLNRVVITSLVL